MVAEYLRCHGTKISNGWLYYNGWTKTTIVLAHVGHKQTVEVGNRWFFHNKRPHLIPGDHAMITGSWL